MNTDPGTLRTPRGTWPVESRPIERGIGCISVVPGAFIGLAGLADYAGPKGWRGFSEFLGWAVICAAAGIAVGLLLAQWRRRDSWRYAAVPIALAAIAAFTYAPYWLGVDAPMTAKVVYTTCLQNVGSVAVAGTFCWFAYILWSDSRRC